MFAKALRASAAVALATSSSAFVTPVALRTAGTRLGLPRASGRVLAFAGIPSTSSSARTASFLRKTTSAASASSKQKRSKMAMGIEIVPLAGGLEAALAVSAGHLAGVVVGLSTVLWSTVLKTPVTESLGPLKPAGSVIGSVLTFLTVAMLGVRAFTAGPDSRYLEGFPTDIAHPQGCTRVTSEGSNKDLPVPTFSSSVEEVQGASKEWLEAQPRTKIEVDVPGYLHAKSLSRLFGFPDSIAVKTFKNKSGKTEVWVQSELRVGQSDLGVNEERMTRFLNDLEKKLS